MAAPAPQKTTPPAAPAISPVDEIMKVIDAMTERLERSLPKQMPVQKFIQYARIAIIKEPKLLEADRASLYNSIEEAAQDGLYLDGREAFLSVFNVNVGRKDNPTWVKRAKYMPMVHGIMKKVRNSGELSTLACQVVHKNDEYKFWVDDTGEHVKHVPLSFADRGDMIGVYALARTKDGATYAEEMSKEQVMAVKAKSKAQESLMWTEFQTEGWRKSVMKRLSKRLPMSSDLAVVFDRDNDLFDLAEGAQPAKATTKSSRLNKIVAPALAPAAPAPAKVEPAQPAAHEEEPPIEDEDQVPV